MIPFALSFFAIMAVFIIYPFTLFVMSFLPKKEHPSKQKYTPRLSILVVFHNAEPFIQKKIANCLNLKYPTDMIEFCFCSDGSTDGSIQLLNQCNDQRIKVFHTNQHLGKINAINKFFNHCSGEIVIFSDIDAMLKPESAQLLVQNFGDNTVGGVCGLRVIAEGESGRFKQSQQQYIHFDSWIKEAESAAKALSANDGKLYAIRKKLFSPIANAVTDDLFVLLCVVEQGYKFIFCKEATASIQTPSRHLTHEWQRRRRIVSTSLRGIYIKKKLLNPYKYGFFSIGLFVNKIMRRLLFVFLLTFYVYSYIFATTDPFYIYLSVIQSIFYGTPIILLFTQQGRFSKIPNTILYFMLGVTASFVGVVDFFCRKRYDKWSPIKE